MFKKNLLAIAVLAMTSGVVLADNEAYISQGDENGTASTATIEQVYTDVASAHFGMIVQNITDTSTATIYQGLTDTGGTAGTIDPTAPALTTPAATAIDPASPAYADLLANAYTPLTAAVTNFAIIKQDGSANASAGVYQVTADEVADLDAPVTNPAGATAGIDAGTLTDGTVEITPASAENSGNIAAIAQGSAPIDRAGNALGAAAQGDASDAEIALVIQMGTGNMGQIMQAGDAQYALVIQDGTSNDAFVAQYAGSGNSATITQVATQDIATVYQAGTGNTARIYQHPAL